MAKKAKMGLTQEQYSSMCQQGQELHDYWREWNRKLYNQAVTDGDLYELVSTMGRQMQDQMDQLMQQGLNQHEAHAIVWEEIYSSYQP